MNKLNVNSGDLQAGKIRKDLWSKWGKGTAYEIRECIETGAPLPQPIREQQQEGSNSFRQRGSPIEFDYTKPKSKTEAYSGGSLNEARQLLMEAAIHAKNLLSALAAAHQIING